MKPYILLAKSAVENYIKEGKVLKPSSDLPKALLTQKAGIFVTIEKKLEGLPGDKQKLVLRGCIGTCLPTQDNIAEEIIHNAIAAATQDDRFNPIKKQELPLLYYTVYVLNAPEHVSDIKKLDPKKYGIIVKSGFKSGLLLPDLEGINTIEEQIFIACQKAGIFPAEEKLVIYRFTTEKYAQEKNRKNKNKKDGKIKETDIQKVVNHYFFSKGLNLEQIKKDAKKKKIIYSRFTRPAKQLLELAGSVGKAKKAISTVADWAKSRNLDYAIETVFKKWLELDLLKPKEVVKKPYYRDDPMVWSTAKRKWYVIDKNDEWLEFADKESKIEWKTIK